MKKLIVGIVIGCSLFNVALAYEPRAKSLPEALYEQRVYDIYAVTKNVNAALCVHKLLPNKYTAKHFFYPNDWYNPKMTSDEVEMMNVLARYCVRDIYDKRKN